MAEGELQEFELLEQVLEEVTPAGAEGHKHHHHHHHHKHKHHQREEGDDKPKAHPEDDDTLAHQTMVSEVGLDESTVADEPKEDPTKEEFDLPLGNFMFCDGLKRFKPASAHSHHKFLKPEKKDSALLFYSKHYQPSTTNNQLYVKGHLPGLVAVAKLFHMESNRESRGPDDDGLEDSDLTAADGVVRVKKDKNARKTNVMHTHDTMKLIKGEFSFPHRTYKPKVQIAYRVPPGEVPQAVMAERLHRIYKKTDINLVLQQLGIELSDLIPPPLYGETNERFYQEMMYRNRTKINGIDKKEVIAHTGGRITKYALLEELEEHEEANSIHKAESDSTLSANMGMDDNATEPPLSPSRNSSKTSISEQEEEEQALNTGKDAIHPFIQSKPPFNPQLPLSYFDNTEYDIRSGEEWCRLGWDDKERRFHPLPAKAFLPFTLPQDVRDKITAPSEVTIEEILRRTPRLERFRAWLLRERYERQIRLVGLDPAKIPRLTPSEVEMAIVARLGSTVENFGSLSDDSMEEIHKAAKKFSERLSKIHRDIESVSVVMRGGSEADGEEEDEGDEDGDSDTDLNKDSQENVRDEDQLNIVFKERRPRRDIDDVSDEDTKGLGGNKEAKKSVSLLSDVFSDLESLTMMGSDIVTSLQQGGDQGTEAEEMEDESDGYGVDRMTRGINRPARSYFMGDYGIHIPSSPDIDPFEDGLENFVIDFDKMKKVHIYDWRWVEVAVFDYHPAEDKYFVRSIHAPFVYAWVSKVYLCFDAEDPNKHGLRIKDAVTRRFEFENAMRYNLFVDCLPVIDFPLLDEDVMERVTNRAVTASNLQLTEAALVKVRREINLEFQRNIADEKFQYIVVHHPKTFYPWVRIPDKSDPILSSTDIENHSKVRSSGQNPFESNSQNFEYLVKNLQKNTVIYTEEGWTPYKEIMLICKETMQRPIILVDDLLPMRLDEWELLQSDNIEETKNFLMEEWYDMVVRNLKSNFSKSSKSWYNLNETNYDVFLLSKMSNFLQLVKLLMQDTLRSIVVDSILNLTNRIKHFAENVDPKTDWSWGENLIDSEFPPPKGHIPIWTIDMYMDSAHGPKFAQPLNSFPRIIYSLYTKTLTSVQSFPTLLMMVMPQMQFAALGFLRGVYESEVEMLELLHDLIKFTKLVLLPLDSYIRKFGRYKDIWKLDIPTYIKKLEASNPTAQDIKKLVEQNRRHIERLEREIPSEIKITAFRVIVEPVREAILKKKRNLISAILDNYAYKLRKIIQKVMKDYGDMERKLTLRSDDIEEVMELKSYVEIVPSLVSKLDNITNAVIKDYEVFDYFMYSIPNEDVNAKWQAAINSVRMTRLGKDAVKMLEDDYERLLKVQQADLGGLSDQVDGATLLVAGLAAFTELEKARDVCEEIRKIWRIILELQEQCDLLNRRQKIFGLGPAQAEALQRLIRDIEPFKYLWFTVSDWLTVQEQLYSGSLDKLEVENMKSVISEGNKVMGKCIKYFTGADQIQHIAKSMKKQLEDFKPLVPLVLTLKKPELRQRHWQSISEVLGYPIAGSVGQHMKKIMETTNQKQVKAIKKIGDLATKEYEVELHLNQMINEMSAYQIKVGQKEEFKLPIVYITEELMKSVNGYIEVTEELMKNPYNEPFHDKLFSWEKKIKAAKVTLETWSNIQERWINVQTTFLDPEVAQKMPVSQKLYLRIQRIWKRLIRFARDTHETLDLISDVTTASALHQLVALLAQLDASLADYMRRMAKGSDESDED